MPDLATAKIYGFKDPLSNNDMVENFTSDELHFALSKFRNHKV